MKRLFEKIPVIKVALETARLDISIGDDVTLRLSDTGTYLLFCNVKRRFWLRVFGTYHSRQLGQLDPIHGDQLIPYLEKSRRLRIRIVDIKPQHLSPDQTDSVHVSIWADDGH